MWTSMSNDNKMASASLAYESFETECPDLFFFQLSGPPHAHSVPLYAQHGWSWGSFLLFLIGPMSPDPRLHNPQHLPWRAAEGSWSTSLLCPAHITHPVPPWCQPAAPRTHQGNLQPLHQADLQTHSQVNMYSITQLTLSANGELGLCHFLWGDVD